jgi:site-specific DNA recombinase
MKIDAFYGRNSTDEQAEKGTIESQVDYGKKYFDLNEITDYEMYLDEATSGTIALGLREHSLRMFNDVKQGKIKTVYVYRLDRLARSVKHVLDTYEFLEAHDVRLISMTEAFDTGTPTGKFFMTLLASIAALERDVILERTQSGKDRNARAGKWVSGASPFGYRIGEEGKLIIHDKEAETVRLIFKLYSEGMTMFELAKYLNAKGVETPATSKGTLGKSTGKWHAGHVSIVLKTEAYTGIYNYLQRSKKNRETIEVEVPTLIDIEFFNSMQKKILSNSDNSRGKKGRLYLLRGVIFCGHCGRAMIGNSGGTNKAYYRCGGTMDQGQGKRCSAKQMKATVIEEAVWTDILEIVKNPEQFKEYVDKSIAKTKETIIPMINELAEAEESIQLKQKAKGRILSLITRGIISDQDAEKELKSLSLEIRSLISRKEYLFEQQDISKSIETDVINSKVVFDFITKQSQTLDEKIKARIIRGLVKKIEVFTIEEDSIKRGNKAVMLYRLGRSLELRLSGDSQLQTNLYNVESTWEFQAFSRRGGHRIKWS